MRAVKTWSTPAAAGEKALIPCNLCGGKDFKPSLFCEGFSYVRCVSCGLVQMNPQPVLDDVKKRYGASGRGALKCGALKCEGFGDEYLAYELANEESFLNLQLLALSDAGFAELETLLFEAPLFEDEKQLPSAQKPRVLDIGCATGSLLSKLRSRGWETTGVEISLPQAEYARQKRGLDVRNLPLEENHFPAGFFDAVLASHLVEHLNDPASMLLEVHRILVPGGRFFVTTPNIAGFQSRLYRGRWRSAIFDHLYLFSIKTLSRMLVDKGFTIEKTAAWGGLAAGTAPAPVKRFFDKTAKRFGFGDVMIIRAVK